MPTKLKNLQILLSLTLIGALFFACDRSINPFEDEQGVFSVYGALDVGKNRNIVRVRNLKEPFSSETSFPLDATVSFTDLETGTVTQLRDTVVNFEVGKTHNFILDEQLDLKSGYQITVERSDGASVTTTATTPGLTDADFFPKIFISCETKINIRFGNVEPTELVQMEIGAVYENEIHWGVMDLVGELEYDPQLEIMRVVLSPRNLLVEVFTPVLPDNPYFDPLMLFPTVSCSELDTHEIFIRYTHFGPEWSAARPFNNGPIDIESGDVENGLGFFGAYRVDTFSIPLSEEE